MRQQLTSKMASKGLGTTISDSAFSNGVPNYMSSPTTNFDQGLLNIATGTSNPFYNILQTGPSVPQFDSNGNLISGSTNTNTSQVAQQDILGSSTSGTPILTGTDLYSSAESILTNGPIDPIEGGINWQGILVLVGVGLAGFIGIKLVLEYK